MRNLILPCGGCKGSGESWDGIETVTIASVRRARATSMLSTEPEGSNTKAPATCGEEKSSTTYRRITRSRPRRRLTAPILSDDGNPRRRRCDLVTLLPIEGGADIAEVIPATTPDVWLLVDELQTHLASLHPPESRHGFRVDRMARESVAFFVLRVDRAAAGSSRQSERHQAME